MANLSNINNKFLVTTGGNVGINSTGPTEKLAIEGSGSANESILRVNNQGQFSSRIWLRNAGQSAYIFNSGTTADTLATGLLSQAIGMGIGNTSPIQFYNGTPASVKMTIDSSGNVGIGTTSPGYMLDVAEKIRMVAGLKITPTTSNLYATDGALSYYAASNAVYLNGAGASGWLRLNAAGTENNTNSINILGSAAGALINFQTVGVTRMVIQSDGVVYVSGQNNGFDGTIRIGQRAYIEHRDAGNTTTSIISNYNSDGAKINFKLKGVADAAAQMTITGGGYVGIGTTSPGYKLNVINDDVSTWTARFTNNTNNVYLSVNDGNNYGIYVSGETKNYFSGNVGIGTVSPAHKLEVIGNINIPGTDNSYLINGYQVANYSYFGYSTGYPGIVIGNTGAQSLFFNVDPVGNPSGSFNGGGQEYVYRNVGSFITPNSANNGYNSILSWNSSGQPYFSQNVGIGVTSPGQPLEVAGNIKNTTYINTGGQASAMLLGRGNAMSGSYLANDFLMFNTGGDCLILGTGGAGMIVKATTGNVGIGTISPSKTLEVAGSYKLGTNAWIQYDAVYPYTISMLNGAGVGNLILNAGYGSSGYESKIELQGTNTATSAGITLSTASTTKMIITANGGVFLSPATGSYGLSQNDVNQVMNSGYTIGTTVITYTYTCSDMSSMFIECVFNHYGYVTSYGCARVATFANGPVMTIQDISVTTTANGGSWSIARVSDTSFTVTKNAGTYGGGGYYYIKINGARVFSA